MVQNISCYRLQVFECFKSFIEYSNDMNDVHKNMKNKIQKGKRHY